MLRLNPQHRYIVAINLNFSNPVFALGDLDGNILNAFDIYIADETPIESCLELVKNSIRILLQSLGGKASDVCCIAIAAPGVYDDTGQLVSFNDQCGGPAWWELDIKSVFSQAFALPIIVYNDVNAAALGEWSKGVGNQEPNMIYFSAGLGVGAAILLDGQLLYGDRFDAGEIYDYVSLDSLESEENFESTIFIEQLKKRCQDAYATKTPPSFEKIVKLFDDAHPETVAIVEDICQRLAVVTYNLMNFISVSCVVFGGEYAPFIGCYVKQLNQIFFHRKRPMPTIKATSLGRYAGIQGMLFLAKEQYFQEVCTE